MFDSRLHDMLIEERQQGLRDAVTRSAFVHTTRPVRRRWWRGRSRPTPGLNPE
jgi:hypothetical protein